MVGEIKNSYKIRSLFVPWRLLCQHCLYDTQPTLSMWVQVCGSGCTCQYKQTNNVLYLKTYCLLKMNLKYEPGLDKNLNFNPEVLLAQSNFLLVYAINNSCRHIKKCTIQRQRQSRNFLDLCFEALRVLKKEFANLKKSKLMPCKCIYWQI